MKHLLGFFIALCLFNANAQVFGPSFEQEVKEKAFTDRMKAMGAKLSEEDKSILREASAKMMEKIKDPGLKTGDKAPLFDLYNAYGKKISLGKELTKGPVILVFYRGSWCPYCNLHLKVLNDTLPEFKKYGAQLVTVTPQTPDRSAEQFKKDGYLFEVLTDADYKVMKSYNLYFEPQKERLDVYKKIGLNIEDYNGEGRSGLPVPGTFVIDQSGIIKAVHAKASYWERMEPMKIVEVLRAITK